MHKVRAVYRIRLVQATQKELGSYISRRNNLGIPLKSLYSACVHGVSRTGLAHGLGANRKIYQPLGLAILILEIHLRLPQSS